MSSALLHYYFATRRELLGRAFAFADTRVDAHVLWPSSATTAQRAIGSRRLLIAYLSPEAVVTEDWVVWSELWRSARFDESLRELLHDADREWLAQVAGLLREGIADGSIDALGRRRRQRRAADLARRRPRARACSPACSSATTRFGWSSSR